MSQRPQPPQSSFSSNPHDESESGAGAGWKKQKKLNAMGHTAKEKLRRASIVTSCNSFRNLVPNVKDADKATVFRTSVEFLAFLRTRISGAQLNTLDREFADILSLRLQQDTQSSRLEALPDMPTNVHTVDEALQSSDIFTNQVRPEAQPTNLTGTVS